MLPLFLTITVTKHQQLRLAESFVQAAQTLPKQVLRVQWKCIITETSKHHIIT